MKNNQILKFVSLKYRNNTFTKNVHIRSYEQVSCPEDGDSTFSRNVWKFLENFKVSRSDDTRTAVRTLLAINLVIKIFIWNRLKTEYKQLKR
jgi:hypothetical protein